MAIETAPARRAGAPAARVPAHPPLFGTGPALPVADEFLGVGTTDLARGRTGWPPGGPGRTAPTSHGERPRCGSTG
jgi:hypothetical protein